MKRRRESKRLGIYNERTGRAESKQSRGLMEARGSFFLHIHVKDVCCLLHLASGVYGGVLSFLGFSILYSPLLFWLDILFSFPLSHPDIVESQDSGLSFLALRITFLFVSSLVLIYLFCRATVTSHGDGRSKGNGDVCTPVTRSCVYIAGDVTRYP